MTIGIIGLGYVGLTLAIAAVEGGAKVFGKEINPVIIENIRNNKAHFHEPGLDALIAKHNERDFFCKKDFPTDIKFDAFIITVGTPLKEGTTKPNLDYIRIALESIRKNFTGSELVVLRSTVSVGTTRNIVIPLLKEMNENRSDEVYVSMCPERTIEGNAIEELRELPQIISGNNKTALQRARELFSIITSKFIEAESLEAAELAKLFNNIYRDMNFALGNVLNFAAQEFGVDGRKVILAANKDYVRSNIALPGFVAGPCLEKDAYILADNMMEGPSKKFILDARKYNEQLEMKVTNFVDRTFSEFKNIHVCILGMAFKGKPETSDLRGSSSVRIAKKLYDKGYKLHLHDFVAYRDEIDKLGLGIFYDSINDAIYNCNIILILNNHEKYKKITNDFFQHDEKVIVLDAWCVTGLKSDDNIKVVTFGDMDIIQTGMVRD